MRKIKSVMLYTGYAESCSWGALILTHDIGFDTLQDALLDLRRLAQAQVDREYEDAVHGQELTNRFLSQYGKPPQVTESPKKQSIEDWWDCAIRGDGQSCDVWNALVEEGEWTTWTEPFDWQGRVEIQEAPSLIEGAPKWPEQFAHEKEEHAHYGTKWFGPSIHTYLDNAEGVVLVEGD